MTLCFFGKFRNGKASCGFVVLNFPISGQPETRSSVGSQAMANQPPARKVLGKMSMDEYKQLGGLLQKAREENRLGEVMVIADVEKDVWEQLQRYQAPLIGPKAKPKAKVVRDYKEFATDASSSGGAMTDAAKRRLEDDLASMAASEGWEDVEVLASHADVERAIAEHGYTASGMVGTPFLTESTPADLAPIDVSWYPALSYDDLDGRYNVPPTLDSTARWATTICICPKWKAYEWTYEHMIRRALAGDKEMAKYLTWLKSTYSKIYLEKGAKSPGIDLAGFLGRIKFDELLMASNAHAMVEGFTRTLAQ